MQKYAHRHSALIYLYVLDVQSKNMHVIICTQPHRAKRLTLRLVLVQVVLQMNYARLYLHKTAQCDGKIVISTHRHVPNVRAKCKSLKAFKLVHVNLIEALSKVHDFHKTIKANLVVLLNQLSHGLLEWFC